MRNPSLLGSSTSTKTPCCSKVGIKKGPWTPEEDEVLANYVKREGEGRWRTLPKRAGLLRCGKSCRLRWMNYLRPCVKRGRIAPDEEDLILRLHRLLGNRWSLIAGRIPGRTDNEIKNYWNTHLSKKLISHGIDPRTHKPLNHVSHSSSKANQDYVPESNPKPPSSNSSESGEKTITMATANLEYHHQQYHENQQAAANRVANWPNSEGTTDLIMGQPSSYGNEGDYIENGNEDTFSLFLDSLINDNIFINPNQQQQPQSPQQPNNVVAVAAFADQSYSYGKNWEAEIMSSMVAFGNQQNSSDNHHLQHQP